MWVVLGTSDVCSYHRRMIKSWQNIVLVMCLALLQSIAPLLHAHLHDVSIPGKIHFHTLEVDPAYTPADTGVYQLTKHLADEDAIGMESVGKNEFSLSISNLTALISAILVALLPVTQLFMKEAPPRPGALFCPPFLLPYSSAPPPAQLN